MVQILYSYFELCTYNNGVTSQWFSPSRGIRQTGPESGYLYLLVTEILSINISNQRIKGININGYIEVISQFADDTGIFSLFQTDSLQAIINDFEEFYQNTGLKVNYDKTTIFRIGALKNSQQKLAVSKTFKCLNDQIDTLGLMIVTEDINNMNFKTTSERAENLLKLWRMRDLSLFGRINVINTLIGSLFIYKMHVLPLLSNNFIAKFQHLITDFMEWQEAKA